MNLQRFLTAILLCLCLAACHSSRKATVADNGTYRWSTLEVPVKVSVEKPVSLSCSGKAMLVRDSAIYVSMRMLGMEIAYLYADADSAVLCDRFHKLYISEPLDRLLPARYARIGLLQQLMLGLESPDAISDRLQYSHPAETPLGKLYSLLRLQTSIAKKDIDASIIYNYNKARWDDPDFSMPSAKLPRNAKKIDPQALLKGLKDHTPPDYLQ